MSASNARMSLSIEVVDVSSTAVSLCIFAHSETSLGANGIEIKLNNEPWLKTVISDPAAFQVYEDEPLRDLSWASNSLWYEAECVRNGATVVVYGLEPGKEYEIELDVVQSIQTAQGELVIQQQSKLTKVQDQRRRHLRQEKRLSYLMIYHLPILLMILLPLLHLQINHAQLPSGYKQRNNERPT